jgi:antitoxin VapB
MGLNIKNPTTEAAIRELATTRGVGLTEAVDQAVREALGREARTKETDWAERRRRIEEITTRFASRPRLDPRPAAEIMDDLYDADGLPC